MSIGIFKLFINSLILFTNIDLPQELKCSLLRLRCLCGFILEQLIKRIFFLLHSSISMLLRVLPFSFRSFLRATMFEMATYVHLTFNVQLHIEHKRCNHMHKLYSAARQTLQPNVIALKLRNKIHIRSFSAPHFPAFGHLVRIREDTNQENSEYGQFLRSVT